MILFQLYRPVGVVEELFPAFVALVAEMDVDEGIVPGLDGLFDEGHAGMFRGMAAFFDVAGGAGTNDIFPGCLAAQAARNDVVER